MMQIATVAKLWRYRVKSLAAEALDRVAVNVDGLEGDRTRALIVASPDHARSGKPLRGKEHGRLHTLDDEHAAIDAALAAGVMVDVASGERFFDAQPVSLLFDAWVREVEGLVGMPLDPLRWRANIYAHAAIEIGAEAGLVGATLGIGDAVLTVVQPIGRCITTTYDIDGGPAEPAVLREVVAHRDKKVGVYCTVTRPGTIACGDAVVRL
jgi:uncharacterized protein YcbX